MNYATVQDMIDRYGEPEMIQLTDPDILAVQASKAQRALDDAQACAISRCSGTCPGRSNIAPLPPTT